MIFLNTQQTLVASHLFVHQVFYVCLPFRGIKSHMKKKFLLIFKKKFYIFISVCLFGVFPWEHASICMCVYMCMCMAVCALAMMWGQKTTCRVCTFLLLWCFRGSNAGHQSWCQAPLQAILFRRIVIFQVQILNYLHESLWAFTLVITLDSLEIII